MPTINDPRTRRVYPLRSDELSPEQIAVTFAMTSRNPQPFDEIAEQVSETRAADFNERWVTGYGHASVAEHASLHLAVENISRLVCDIIEDNRLASFTEKSSRFQQLDGRAFVIPEELKFHPAVGERYAALMRDLFDLYGASIEAITDAETELHPRREGETESAHRLRVRRPVYDACRALLPAATLTNVGITMNARTMEYAISKLLSMPIVEAMHTGQDLLEQSLALSPTLVKYAGPATALDPSRRETTRPDFIGVRPIRSGATLVETDQNPLERLVQAHFYRTGIGYRDAQEWAQSMDEDAQCAVVQGMLNPLRSHDPLPREFEHVNYTYEFVLDYGGLREFRRHRMASPLFPYLTCQNGYEVPDLVERHGWGDRYRELLDQTTDLFLELQDLGPELAQYVVTHAHLQRVLVRWNLREFSHVMRLRSSQRAHPSIRMPVIEAIHAAVNAQPELFTRVRPRHAGDWWPIPAGG